MSPAKGEKLIEVKGLEKHFKHVEVLRGINIDICKGDVVAVIGPSGSGKSTFLRCLNLLEEPTGGQIVFEGVDITSKETKIDQMRQKIGMVFQQFNLFTNMTARTIRIPVHMVETINKLTRIQRQLVQDLGRDPSAEEIAAKMENISPEKVREIQKIALEPVSLETPIGEEDDSHLGDFIEDKEALSPDEYANNQLLKDEINTVLQGLTEREEKVLRLRFGLYDGRTRTLEEVGKEFNVTRERIRQIEAKALRKLKHPTRSKRLKDFVDKP